MASVAYRTKQSPLKCGASCTTLGARPRQSRCRKAMSSWCIFRKMLMVLMFMVELNTANPVKNRSRSMREQRLQMEMLYNFTCLEPSEKTVKLHSKFADHAELTPNRSLQELRDQLIYIEGLAGDFARKYANEQHDYEIGGTLDYLPTPRWPNESLPNQYKHAFNEANLVIVPYLNELENIKLNMLMNKTILDARFFNLTDIQRELEDWLHDLHRRMVQQQMRINCEAIKKALSKPYRKSLSDVKGLTVKGYLSLMMDKFTKVVNQFTKMFDTAIQRDNEFNSIAGHGGLVAKRQQNAINEVMNHRQNRHVPAMRRLRRHRHRHNRAQAPF